MIFLENQVGSMLRLKILLIFNLILLARDTLKIRWKNRICFIFLSKSILFITCFVIFNLVCRSILCFFNFGYTSVDLYLVAYEKIKILQQKVKLFCIIKFYINFFNISVVSHFMLQNAYKINIMPVYFILNRFCSTSSFRLRLSIAHLSFPLYVFIQFKVLMLLEDVYSKIFQAFTSKYFFAQN